MSTFNLHFFFKVLKTQTTHINRVDHHVNRVNHVDQVNHVDYVNHVDHLKLVDHVVHGIHVESMTDIQTFGFLGPTLT